MEMEVEDAGGPASPAAVEKLNTEPSQAERDKSKKRQRDARRQWMRERRSYYEMLVKACLLKHIKEPHREKPQEAIRTRFEAHSMSV